MRWLLGCSAIWLVAVLWIGVSGTFQLTEYWRTAEDRLLVSDAAVAATLFATELQQGGHEDDPSWLSLESSWNVDCVDLYRDSSQVPAESTTRTASVTANERTRTGPGRWRISRCVPCDAKTTAASASVPNQQVLLGFRVTRIIDFSRVNRIWWSLWGATCALGSCAIIFTVQTLRTQHRKRLAALQTWVVAAQQISSSKQAHLPENNPSEADLAVQLSILHDAVNGWLSDLQNSVQRNELVLSNLQEGVLAVDDKSRVLLANAASVRLLDISTDSYLYRSLVEVIRAPRVVSIIERVLASCTPQEESFEYGSQQLSLRVLVRPVQLGGARVGALMTVRDETLLKRIESVRRDFVTNASHELKTPLAAIRAYAETLQMGAIDDVEATQNFLAGILSQADRINGLITGMLQLARVQTGGAMLKRVRFEVQSEIESCLAAAAVMAKSKTITLTEFLPVEPLFMQGDPEAVKTVVSNLLSNAVRYTPSGGQVSLRLSASGAGLTIRVQDSGVGIEKDELARIFERFYRVERARTADTGGTGLGLSIVKHLLQALGGSVTVTSEPQVGSCFEVYLPLEPS